MNGWIVVWWMIGRRSVGGMVKKYTFMVEDRESPTPDAGKTPQVFRRLISLIRVAFEGSRCRD